MVKGIGTDIIEIGRIEKEIKSEGQGFIERVFGEDEIKYCEKKKKKFQHYAVRFAAKEAVFKALGTGWRDGISWRDIEIVNNEKGKPEVALSGKALEITKQAGINQIYISLSHSDNYAVAVAILETLDARRVRREASSVERNSGGIFMSNIGSYEEKSKNFDWSISKKDLAYTDGSPINIGYYCAERNCEKGLGKKLALIWEGHTGEVKTYTFDNLRVHTNTFAKFLKDLGLEPGDRICIFMDRIPELYFSFLGILKMGGIAQPLFSAFGEEALFTRLDDAETSAILTQKKHLPKVRKIKDQLPELKHIIIVDADGMPLKDKEVPFSLDKMPSIEKFDIFPSTAETPSVLHYTSGTTGKPKGALHVHSSLMSQYLTVKWVLDLKPEDIYWCTADPGWVTGTSYGIIGPWSLGITQVVLDSGFMTEKWYGLIERHKITVWYSAPTAIRTLMREGQEIVKKFNLSSLRHLCSVGEPLNPEAVLWAQEVFGLPFHDTYWQTETGCIVITNFPGMKIKPGSMGKPFPGIKATVVDPKNFEPVRTPGTVGLIALKPGWPSMFRTYWNNEETYKNKFKNGWYICGDRASLDSEGYFWFVGRDDDVINTAGHLVGPFEIESALIEHEAIAESAAVGKPDPVNMEVVKAFVALKPGFEPSDDLELNIMNFIRKKLSPLAMPQEIEFVKSLPKTRSGKIMRRLLRAQEWGESIGDISTLEND